MCCVCSTIRKEQLKGEHFATFSLHSQILTKESEKEKVKNIIIIAQHCHKLKHNDKPKAATTNNRIAIQQYRNRPNAWKPFVQKRERERTIFYSQKPTKIILCVFAFQKSQERITLFFSSFHFFEQNEFFTFLCVRSHCCFLSFFTPLSPQLSVFR